MRAACYLRLSCFYCIMEVTNRNLLVKDMQHKGTKILETERLLLRRWKESDAEEAFARWMNDSDVT